MNAKITITWDGEVIDSIEVDPSTHGDYDNVLGAPLPVNELLSVVEPALRHIHIRKQMIDAMCPGPDYADGDEDE